ncbi:MAG: GH116 family glycosyl hydrolase [Candidatus Ratteibacteria bacterium]
MQRPGFAFGKEGGVILCTWPKGKKPTLPFIYCDEIWTGFEYQFAGHLISSGFVRKGLEVVETARKRHDGTKRNPFDEYECGHWYGRALSSYGLILSYTGLKYDGLEKTLYFKRFRKGNFKVFFSTEGGWGIAGIKNRKPFVQVLHGKIDIKKIQIIK